MSEGGIGPRTATNVMNNRKLTIVSTRLPVSLRRVDGAWQSETAPGGLATALRSVVRQRPSLWIGWPGTTIPRGERRKVDAELSERFAAHAVFLDASEHEAFYEEISNRVLWPLFHYLTEVGEFNHRAWSTYLEVNQRFADETMRRSHRNDLVWVNDYQLSLVPQMLRDAGHKGPIGFFLHIPFPSSEIFRTLPVRGEILRGMLGADLLGFHTYEYVGHFRNAALRILGYESSPEQIWLPTHHARLETLPVGIEPQDLRQLAHTTDYRTSQRQTRNQIGRETLVIGVDRLDYTKGIPYKLRAYERLLESRPELCEKVRLLQVASPSRTGVAEYQALKREIDEQVGRINGRFGTVNWTPVVYIHQHLSQAQLLALYERADVALITSIRDGMNLVALEYVAARRGKPGTLLLSEFTGAATCLTGATLVNPYDVEGLARTLAQAIVTQPNKDEFARMESFVESNTASAWAAKFVDSLEQIESTLKSAKTLRLDRGREHTRAAAAKHPLLLLEYDGTLIAHAASPEDAAPAEEVLALLRALAQVATVYVISGRPARTMTSWLGDLAIGLVCEHGLAIRPPGGRWLGAHRHAADRHVLEEVVRPLLEEYTRRTPGSRIEIKRSSIAWHYRQCTPKLGVWRARELRMVLEGQLSGGGLGVLAGDKVLEVRPVDSTKGHAALELLSRHPEVDWVLAIGNDRTDEDMFAALSGQHHVTTCLVGGGSSLATLRIPNPQALHEELWAFVRSRSDSHRQ